MYLLLLAGFAPPPRSLPLSPSSSNQALRAARGVLLRLDRAHHPPRGLHALLRVVPRLQEPGSLRLRADRGERWSGELLQYFKRIYKRFLYFPFKKYIYIYIHAYIQTYVFTYTRFAYKYY